MSVMNLARVFEKLHTHYDAICIFQVSTDSIFQLKYPISCDETLAASQQLCWSKALLPVVRNLVSESDHLAVYDFLLPSSLQEALPTMESRAEIVFRSQNDHWKKLVVHPLSLKDGKVDEILYLLTDQTVEFSRFDSLKALSERDELTYLYNRTKLNQMIDQEYSDLDTCGVLFFDVNNLKPINDYQGHDVGDTLLCIVAESLRSVVNRDVQAFRYGGDEFAVIMKKIGDEQAAIKKGTEICSALHKCALEENLSCLSSCGIALWSSDDEMLENVIERADKALYRAKQENKGNCCLCEE